MQRTTACWMSIYCQLLLFTSMHSICSVRLIHSSVGLRIKSRQDHATIENEDGSIILLKLMWSVLMERCGQSVLVMY